MGAPRSSPVLSLHLSKEAVLNLRMRNADEISDRVFMGEQLLEPVLPLSQRGLCPDDVRPIPTFSLHPAERDRLICDGLGEDDPLALDTPEQLLQVDELRGDVVDLPLKRSRSGVLTGAAFVRKRDTVTRTSFCMRSTRRKWRCAYSKCS